MGAARPIEGNAILAIELSSHRVIASDTCVGEASPRPVQVHWDPLSEPGSIPQDLLVKITPLF